VSYLPPCPLPRVPLPVPCAAPFRGLLPPAMLPPRPPPRPLFPPVLPQPQGILLPMLLLLLPLLLLWGLPPPLGCTDCYWHGRLDTAYCTDAYSNAVLPG
jgi:hypothetical protein